MFRNSISLVLCGTVALGLVACSSDKASKSTTSNSTGSSTRVTLSSSATTATTAGAGATTAPTVGGAGPTTTAAPPTATTVRPTGSTTATTAAGRVVNSPSDSVHVGDTGPGVKQIQTALAAQGYKVSVDGNFGSQTATAVKSFQKKAGIKQDGIVGPVTWAKLQGSPSATTVKGATTTTVKGATTTTVKGATTTTVKGAATTTT